jgi:diaminohydroxyphosphoribosylaminopyrimidine deaminase/5-amino-6-(5-phosphoribosylamino)uracil reductase
MHHALALAARALGRVAPNPAVGCVIVAPDGRIVGRGMTQDGGRPHAEAVALAQAGAKARGATAYVTLEPCAHIGKTPPCANALVDAGVARVIVAVTDPDPRVNGSGIKILRDAGIEVTTGVLQAEAGQLSEGFFLRIGENRPLVTLKIAQSADGKTATAPGTSPWITGEEARRFGHLLRAKHDAILVGIETVLTDDPALTCRLPGLEKYSPVRIVLDSKLRLSSEARVVQSAREVPTIVFTTAPAGNDALIEYGVEIIRCEADAAGRLALRQVLQMLAGRGMTRLLVEGGATISSAFFEAGFADRLEIFTAPLILGDRGRGNIQAVPLGKPDEATGFIRVSERSLGQDRLESYAARP